MIKRIGSRDLQEKVLVVAEIGNNHEGRFEVAEELVARAAACGADAVKFQTFKTEHYVGRSDAARFNQLKSFELSYSQFEQLARQARARGVLFISTPFDLASAEFLEGIVDAYKIASGDNTFYPLMARVARSGRPMIISCGASDLQQIGRTVAFVKRQWTECGISGQLAVLHCVSSYPVVPEQANLRAIQCLSEQFDDVTIGYSDHTKGIDAALLAVALGARIIEKHFTLDKHFSHFRDHQIAIDPLEMQELVRRIRSAEAMLGAREKKVQACEVSATRTNRRSIVAGADLPQGHRILQSDLTWIRPAGGLAPGEEHLLVGKRLNRSVHFGEPLQASDVV